jgi:hypothetical protein
MFVGILNNSLCALLKVIHRFILILIGVTDAKNKMYLKEKGVIKWDL